MTTSYAQYIINISIIIDIIIDDYWHSWGPGAWVYQDASYTTNTRWDQGPHQGLSLSGPFGIGLV